MHAHGVLYSTLKKKKKKRKKKKKKKKENMAVTPSFHGDESSISYSSKKRGWHALAV